MRARTRASFVLVGVLLGAVSSTTAGQSCAARLDVADWALVRSADVPGFTLRLPRAFTHDSVERAELAPAGGRSGYLRCEERVGSAVAVIVHYDGVQGSQSGPFVVRARVRWPDGEELDIRGDAPDRERLAQLLTAVRTIRRSGA